MTGDSGAPGPAGRDRELDALIEAARAYPTEPDGARERIMARVREQAAGARPTPRQRAAWWRWWIRPRVVALRPASLLAGALASVLALTAVWRAGGAMASAPSEPGGAMQFVFLAPAAASVSLVGDFNDWRAGATPLRRTGPNGIWSVELTLEPGRHAYAFLVDDVWMPDAFAPRAPDTEFGSPTSVVVVGEERSS